MSVEILTVRAQVYLFCIFQSDDAQRDKSASIGSMMNGVAVRTMRSGNGRNMTFRYLPEIVHLLMPTTRRPLPAVPDQLARFLT